MTPQTKALLIGAGGFAAAMFYFKKDWKMSALIGAAALVAYTVISDLPDKTAP